MRRHFDLRENATRSQLLDTLLEAMDEDARKSFDYIVNHAVVPDKHHHSIGEVRESIDALTVPDQVKADLHAVYEIWPPQRQRYMVVRWKKRIFMK